MNGERRWVLLDAQGRRFLSEQLGTFGGHRGSRIYGRLDCPAALGAIARGGYVRQRVFFADEASARSAGYRPCARCLPREYAAWRMLTTPT
ncbi:Ada metal-binding domain-containing protein [Pseudomonas chlororaphis]|uniref:Metal-binding protein n=1 Tax=Pseudomonas chlororaphis TaxID=587753 RepID=A0A1Q8ESG8_9PSED|nr:Ada metal-binding domain-containing protein [Pseudomonas chlororaphis]OLF54726.1 metal-binding protein [Pseudomonas chlororaphis]